VKTHKTESSQIIGKISPN